MFSLVRTGERYFVEVSVSAAFAIKLWWVKWKSGVLVLRENKAGKLCGVWKTEAQLHQPETKASRMTASNNTFLPEAKVLWCKFSSPVSLVVVQDQNGHCKHNRFIFAARLATTLDCPCLTKVVCGSYAECPVSFVVTIRKCAVTDQCLSLFFVCFFKQQCVSLSVLHLYKLLHSSLDGYL